MIKNILITIGVILTLPFWLTMVVIILFNLRDWEPEGNNG